MQDTFFCGFWIEFFMNSYYRLYHSSEAHWRRSGSMLRNLARRTLAVSIPRSNSSCFLTLWKLQVPPPLLDFVFCDEDELFNIDVSWGFPYSQSRRKILSQVGKYCSKVLVHDRYLHYFSFRPYDSSRNLCQISSTLRVWPFFAIYEQFTVRSPTAYRSCCRRIFVLGFMFSARMVLFGFLPHAWLRNHLAYLC